MPLYKYKCDDCEEEQSVFHSVDEECVSCKFCGSTSMRKIYKTLSSSKVGLNPAKPGTQVKKFIEDAKEDLSLQKKEFGSREL